MSHLVANKISANRFIGGKDLKHFLIRVGRVCDRKCRLS